MVHPDRFELPSSALKARRERKLVLAILAKAVELAVKLESIRVVHVLKTFVFINKVVRPERFELPTFWFVARRSIQLSYGRIGT